MWWNGGWWGGWIMSIGSLVFWVAVIVAAVWLVRNWGGGRREETPPPEPGQPRTPPSAPRPTDLEDPVAVVKRRYAAGEIDREEYVQKLTDLGAPPPAR
jgi:putative membrane protein